MAMISRMRKVRNTPLKFRSPNTTVAMTIAVDPKICLIVAIIEEPWGIKSLVKELAPSVVAGIMAKAFPDSITIEHRMAIQIFFNPDSNNKPAQPTMNNPKPIIITGLNPMRSASRPLRRFNQDKIAAAGTSASPDHNGVNPSICW